MRFVVVLGQGRSGSTLITRLLNLCPGVRISGENGRAFDHLAAFIRAMNDCQRYQRLNRFCELAWASPCLPSHVLVSVQGLVRDLWSGSSLAGFKEIRYGRDSFNDLRRDVDGLQTLMPGMKLILNVRDTDTCMRSSWWASDPEARHTLQRVRENFERLHADSAVPTFWMPYEGLETGSVVLDGMYTFLGLTRPNVAATLQERIG